MTKEYNVELVKDGKVVATAKGVTLSPNIVEKEAQNMPLEIGFKRLSDNAILPTKAHATDSGFDLFAAQDVIIAPGETVVVPTDIALQLPQGYEATVRPRSGITSKTKLRVQLGTIDNGYNAGIGVIIDNTAPVYIPHAPIYPINLKGEYQTDYLDQYLDETYLIRKGDKIAQLVVQPIPTTVAVEITGELDESDRGASGFGSSGV